jgi:hypothetical protein
MRSLLLLHVLRDDPVRLRHAQDASLVQRPDEVVLEHEVAQVHPFADVALVGAQQDGCELTGA